jgi:hypothetical protein
MTNIISSTFWGEDENALSSMMKHIYLTNEADTKSVTSPTETRKNPRQPNGRRRMKN